MINFWVKKLFEPPLTALVLIMCTNSCKINFRTCHRLQKYFYNEISRFMWYCYGVPLYGSFMFTVIITLWTCTCEVIGCIVVVDTKITKSGNLGTWVSCKHNKCVEFGQTLDSVYSELSRTAYEHHSVFLLTIATMRIDHDHYGKDHNVLCSCAQLASYV